MKEDIRQKLIQAAKAGEVVFYMEFGIGRGKTLGKTLLDIAEYERAEGRPMLTALAVSKIKGTPNEGFWNLQGVPKDLSDKQRPVYWAREAIKTINYWQKQP
jgi:hypothetical protein